MLSEQMLPVFFCLMSAALASWLFLTNRFIHLLRSRYPKVYKSLGSPGLLWSKKEHGKTGLLHYLVNRNYLNLNDPELTRLCDGMLAIGCLFLVSLAGCILLISGRS